MDFKSIFKKYRSKKVGLAFAIIIFLVLFLGIPYFTWYLPKRDFQVMADFEVFGFDLSGRIDVSHAVGNRFRFIGNNYNVSIPCEDCKTNSLKVVKGKERGSASYDTILFNGSGKLNVIATNIIFFSYQFPEENTTATMHFVSPQVRSFLVEPADPISPLFFTLEENASERVSISVLEVTCEIFLGFGANNGTLTVSGSYNFSLPLVNDRAGILLEVSIPINRACTTLVDGELDQIYVDNWKTLGCVFLKGLSQSNYFEAMRPNGEFSYESPVRINAASMHTIVVFK